MSKDSVNSDIDGLQHEKLQLEVETLRRTLDPWYRKPPSWFGGIGAVFLFLAAVAGFFVKAREVSQTKQELSETRSSLQAAQIAKSTLESAMSRIQGELNQSQTLGKEMQQKVLDLTSQKSTLVGELTNLKLAKSSLVGEIQELQAKIAVSQRMMRSLAGSTLSNLPTDSLETLARTVIRHIYEEKQSDLKETVNLYQSTTMPEMYFEDNDGLIRDEIHKLRNDIDAMEETYPWLRQ